MHLRRFYLFSLYVSRGVCQCLGRFLVFVGIDLLIDERAGLVTRLADVREGFTRPGSAGVFFILVAPALAIEKSDRNTVLAN